MFEADGALGHVAAPELIGARAGGAEKQATVLVVVREIGHLGSLGIHALSAAEAGVFCLVGQQAPPVTALAMRGFTRAALGKIRSRLRARCRAPIRSVFDMACSEAARGHILLAAREGRVIPKSWAVDEAGEPTTDPQRALRGALLPAGGHKGLGIAMMVEVVGGRTRGERSLDGAAEAAGAESGGSSRVGAFFWFVIWSVRNRVLFDSYMAQWTGFYLASAPGRRAGSRASARPSWSARRSKRDRAERCDGARIARAGRALGVPFPT